MKITEPGEYRATITSMLGLNFGGKIIFDFTVVRYPDGSLRAEPCGPVGSVDVKDFHEDITIEKVVTQ